mmetsp:Transcript_1227/g.1872  ORF Transcript_1227/g.1872 Transcript_1227/m.1872 type:complete len:199 (-) Transcript_1227:74-670(-)
MKKKQKKVKVVRLRISTHVIGHRVPPRFPPPPCLFSVHSLFFFRGHVLGWPQGEGKKKNKREKIEGRLGVVVGGGQYTCDIAFVRSGWVPSFLDIDQHIGDGRRVLHGRSIFDVEGLLSAGSTLGGRRQAIAFPSDAHIDIDGASSTSSSSVYLRFSLPPGAYATSFLGSLCGPFGGSAWAALQARNRKRNKRRRRGS